MAFHRIARLVALSATSALVAGAALVLPAVEASAAPISYAAISAFPGSTTLPASGTKFINFNVSFNGDPYDAGNNYYQSSYAGTTITTVSSRVASPYKPSVWTVPSSSTLRPGVANAFQLRLTVFTSPGRYTIKVPITQNQWNGSSYVKTTKVASRTFDIVANTTFSKAYTSFSAYGKFSKKSKWTVSFRAEEYQRGATLKMYYKASGAKKYKKIASKKLNSKGDASFKTAKGKIRKSGKVYFKVGGVSYAGGYSTSVAKVKKV